MFGAPVTITAPAKLAVSLADALTYCRVDEGLDVEVERQLKAAIGNVEKMTATRLSPQTIEISADRFDELVSLPIGPVTAIAALRYTTPAGTTVVLADDAYELTGAGLERGVRPTIGTAWPAVDSRGGAITLRLVVGYDVPPDMVTLAVLELVRGWSDDRTVDVSAMLVNDRIWL